MSGSFETTAPLDSQKAVGERRQITALFYDIVNSTSLLSSLDPEDFEIVQQRIHTLVASTIRRFDGYLDRAVGDGGWAFFGYPLPIENSAEAAVTASLEIIQQCECLNTPDTGEPVHVRIGVATGVVIFRRKAALNLLGDLEATGLALNLAARLQTIAKPRTVAVAGSTYVLTHSLFDYQSLGSFELKGFAEPQSAWRPIDKRQRSQRFLIYDRPSSPLLDREDELELIQSRWLLAQGGQGQVIFLEGEPGIGKSRLVFELTRAIGETSVSKYIFQCEPRNNARPLQAFTDVVRREVESLTGRPSYPDVIAVREYLASSAPGTRAETADLISFLLNPGARFAPERLNFMEMNIDDFEQLALDAVTDVLFAWSRLRPNLIVFEDLHWADTLTQSLMLRLSSQVHSHPMLVVGTSRTPFSENVPQCPTISTVQLSRLRPAAVPELVASLWGSGSVPPQLVRFIEEKCDGVPLFIEELTHLLKTRLGQVRGDRSDWEHLLKQDGVTTLKDLLTVRMEMLGNSKRTAQIASVLGREFSYELLADITAEDAHDWPLGEHLDALARHSVLYPVTDRERPAFRFRHALFQESAYESLLKSERRQFHDKIVRLNTSKNIGLTDDVMAWHCEQAGRLAEAAHYAIRAAESAAAHWSMKEAESLLKAAEEYLARLTPDNSTIELRLRLLVARGPVVTAIYGSGSPQARENYEQGVQICRNNALQEKDRWFSLYWGWWFTSPTFKVLLDRSAVLSEDFEDTSNPEITLQHLHCSWATYFHAGRHQACLECIAEGLILYDTGRASESRVKFGGHDAKVCALAEKALSLWLIGAPEEAAESIRKAQLWAEEIDHLGSICHALEIAITLGYFQENYDDVIHLAARMGTFSEDYDLPGWAAKSKIYDGWARGLTEDPSKGLDRLEEGLRRQREIGTEEDLPLFLEMRARLLTALGLVHAAISTLDQAIEHASQTGDTFWLPELHRRRGLLRARARHDESLIESDLGIARQLAEQQGATMLAIRAAADIEQLSRRRSTKRMSWEE